MKWHATPRRDWLLQEAIYATTWNSDAESNVDKK